MRTVICNAVRNTGLPGAARAATAMKRAPLVARESLAEGYVTAGARILMAAWLKKNQARAEKYRSNTYTVQHTPEIAGTVSLSETYDTESGRWHYNPDAWKGHLLEIGDHILESNSGGLSYMPVRRGHLSGYILNFDFKACFPSIAANVLNVELFQNLIELRKQATVSGDTITAKACKLLANAMVGLCGSSYQSRKDTTGDVIAKTGRLPYYAPALRAEIIDLSQKYSHAVCTRLVEMGGELLYYQTDGGYARFQTATALNAFTAWAKTFRPLQIDCKIYTDMLFFGNPQSSFIWNSCTRDFNGRGIYGRANRSRFVNTSTPASIITAAIHNYSFEKYGSPCKAYERASDEDRAAVKSLCTFGYDRHGAPVMFKEAAYDSAWRNRQWEPLGDMPKNLIEGMLTPRDIKILSSIPETADILRVFCQPPDPAGTLWKLELKESLFTDTDTEYPDNITEAARNRITNRADRKNPDACNSAYAVLHKDKSVKDLLSPLVKHISKNLGPGGVEGLDKPGGPAIIDQISAEKGFRSRCRGLQKYLKGVYALSRMDPGTSDEDFRKIESLPPGAPGYIRIPVVPLKTVAPHNIRNIKAISSKVFELEAYKILAALLEEAGHPPVCTGFFDPAPAMLRLEMLMRGRCRSPEKFVDHLTISRQIKGEIVDAAVLFPEEYKAFMKAVYKLYGPWGDRYGRLDRFTSVTDAEKAFEAGMPEWLRAHPCIVCKSGTSYSFYSSFDIWGTMQWMLAYTGKCDVQVSNVNGMVYVTPVALDPEYNRITKAQFRYQQQNIQWEKSIVDYMKELKKKGSRLSVKNGALLNASPLMLKILHGAMFIHNHMASRSNADKLARWESVLAPLLYWPGCVDGIPADAPKVEKRAYIKSESDSRDNHVAAYLSEKAATGISQSEYARREGILPRTLSLWLKKSSQPPAPPEAVHIS